MQFERFLDAYGQPVELSTPEKPVEDIFESFKLLGDLFGDALHSYLAGTPDTDNSAVEMDAAEIIDEYDKWGRQAIPTFATAVGRIENETDRKRMTKGNFHTVNVGMSHMWLPLMNGGWENERERLRIIDESQVMLAYSGMNYYNERNVLTNKKSTKDRNSFFTDGYQHYRRWFNGLVNEIDTGIVLLEMIKPHPNLVVVPAPPLFESDGSRENNADFLIIDMEQQEVVGVQAKTLSEVGADQEAAVAMMPKHYNPDRIVVIDGSSELGNTAVKRFARTSSHERIYAWPGLISAYHIQNLPVRGPGANHIENMHRHGKRGVLIQKMMARQALIGAPKSIMKVATHRVSDRVIGALYRTPQETLVEQAERIQNEADLAS